MKVFFVSLLLFAAAFSKAQNYYLPQPKGYVNDYEQLFTPQQEDSLTMAIEDYEQRTTNEIAIVTLEESMIKDADMHDYTLFLLRTWGVGKRKKNNGILIGICKSRRSIVIQNGYGIERVFTNAATKKVIEEDFLPSFREGKYFEGTYKGLLSLMSKVPAL